MIFSLIINKEWSFLNITKALAKRIFGKVKQNKVIYHEFNLNADAGAGHTKKAVNERLMKDIIEWSSKNKIKIEITKPYNHILGINFVVRDYEGIKIIKNASEGILLKNGKEIFL